MANTDDRKPVTIEVMKAYIEILEKQVSQMQLVVSTLGELNEKLEKANEHLHHGLKESIAEQIQEHTSNITEKMEKALTTLYIIEGYVKSAAEDDKESIDRTYKLTTEVKDKIGALRGELIDLKSGMKIDRVTTIAGWSTFVISIITIILRLFGKI